MIRDMDGNVEAPTVGAQAGMPCGETSDVVTWRRRADLAHRGGGGGPLPG